MQNGTVTDFDADRGWGTIRDDVKMHEYFFHCTAIADGSRFIEVGAPCTFVLAPGHGGRFEATDVNSRVAR
ncbi:MAG: hypothetical protein JJLCMIEE_00133 [Acidimicrobiales bacterium]|nr:MAG: cold shock domain-containing protein [Actinomycetota bacterium]MBV6507096.1 hypothetical protein [Acidimicrobiales bacterium]RIK05601.1 MAG: cold-shock protein [Acidobacteriota bacterium]